MVINNDPEIDMMFCPTCARESLTETPPCADGHENCPERACVECGTALVLDAGLVALVTPASHGRAARALRRGAA